VLILEQHVPFGQWAPRAATDALAALLDAYFAHRAAKGIGASIDGVGQGCGPFPARPSRSVALR